MILVDDLTRRLSDLYTGARYRGVICSAFCRSEAFVSVFGHEREVLPLQRLIARWRWDDLTQGVSDLDTYYEATKRGWEVFAAFDLHAKCYIFDDQVVVGSANLTGGGLGAGRGGNVELSMLSETSAALDQWLEIVLSTSVRLNDQIVEAMRQDIQAHIDDGNSEKGQFSSTTMALIYRSGQEFELFTSDFPWTESPEQLRQRAVDRDDRRDREHDLLLFPGLRYGASDVIREQFLQAKCWKWLVTNVTTPRYFGELSDQLHSDLCDDPAPFRKDVKALLSNLLRWAERLLPDFVAVDRPRHSQRIRLQF